MAIHTWFEQGYEDAKQGLPSDPPQYPGHGAYKNYRDGYQCGENDLEREAFEMRMDEDEEDVG